MKLESLVKTLELHLVRGEKSHYFVIKTEFYKSTKNNKIANEISKIKLII